MHYGFQIQPDLLPLLTFLNDGYTPQTIDSLLDNQVRYLICEINGPREITTKVVTESELRTNPIADLIHVLP